MWLHVSAQNDTDDDLYELASQSADEQVEQTDEVLAEDERVYGEEWLTRDRLLVMVTVWVVLQLLAAVLVVKSLRRCQSGWGGVTGWLLVIVVLGVIGGLLYWLKDGRVRKDE